MGVQERAQERRHAVGIRAIDRRAGADQRLGARKAALPCRVEQRREAALIQVLRPRLGDDLPLRAANTSRVPSFLAGDSRRRPGSPNGVRVPATDPDPVEEDDIDWSHLDDQDGSDYPSGPEAAAAPDDWLTSRRAPARGGRGGYPPGGELPPFLRRSPGAGR